MSLEVLADTGAQIDTPTTDGRLAFGVFAAFADRAPVDCGAHTNQLGRRACLRAARRAARARCIVRRWPLPSSLRTLADQVEKNVLVPPAVIVGKYTATSTTVWCPSTLLHQGSNPGCGYLLVRFALLSKSGSSDQTTTTSPDTTVMPWPGNRDALIRAGPRLP